MKFRILLKTVLLLLLLPASSEGKAWRGIVPLHSTRQDVERILGRSNDLCNCIYKSRMEVVTIDYSHETCMTNPTGWRVPRSTVLSINVSTVIPQKLSALNLDLSKFKVRRDLHTGALYYSNDEEGIMHQVTDKGLVALTVYYPSTEDLKLKCDQTKPESHLQMAFDEYGQITFNNEKARLDNYAAQLNHFAESTGYIVFYPASRKSLSKTQIRAQRAKSYLVQVRAVRPDRIVIIQGGCRRALTIELYLLPTTVAPPRPEPITCRR